jgi:hypothetical protein
MGVESGNRRIMETFWQDLRYSLRTLLKKPGFTFVVVTTLALGIGANATIFTWIKAVLLASLPGIEASFRFYVNRLGFTSPWRYDEDGRARVAQVDRQGCALILADTWPEKIGKGLMFISLNGEPETQIAALDALRAELEAKGVPVKEGSWGYRLLVIDDPDGNQLFFNYPSETASGKTV